MAAFGFSNQSVVIETAEDAVDAVGEAQAVYDAVLAIGDERLFRVGAESKPLSELTDATDISLDGLEAIGSPATVAAVENVRELVEESREGEAGESEGLLGSAASELLALEVDSVGDYPTAESRNAAVVNRTAIEALQLREWSWIAYLEANRADAGTIAILSADFATARAAINATRSLDSEGGSTRIEQVLQGDAGRSLTALEIAALDDLSEETLTVTAAEALSQLAEFRSEWTDAVRDQGAELQAAVDAELSDANDLRSLFTLLAAVGVAVLAGLIFVIYRSITNPLESLLERASEVANEALPSLVDTLRHDDGSAELPVAEPIPVTSTDEIGELVSAFNDVQATAYDLATEQALGRRNVADMFVNLGRRNQQLLQRILAQLTELEQNEEDPDKLSDLFELDNVVTRMRRNAESLLALAGAQTARQWSQPIAIDNTVRAAFGEVEGYERIDITDLAEVKVTGSVVADITHLLAELLENAINFSEPHTTVEVTGRIGADGYHIIVEDRGIGMSQRELTDNNTRITDPPPLDQVPTRFLGLYVVGRLAERHNIGVRLSETSSGGISAKVTLPPSIVVTAEDERNTAVARAIEVETSPLEEEHDLDAELASITEAAEDLDEEFDDDLDADLAEDLDSEFDDDVDDDDESDSDLEADVDADLDAEDEVESDSADEPVEVSAESDELPIRGARRSANAKRRKTDKVNKANKDNKDNKVNKTEAVVAPAEEEEPEPLVADGGLPVRNRGGALEQQATPVIDRAAVESRAPTDSSEEAAGSFSSMMSALSSGVARGLEDSETDDAMEGNDK